MRRLAPLFRIPLVAGCFLTGCHQGYSPDTYASSAAQQEAAVQRGIIIGVRQVLISADGTVGAVTGGAAGGVAGSQVAGSPVVTALGAIGGSLVGGIGGTAAAHAVADTKGWEYIVQEPGDRLVSVTQTSKTPLTVGLHVLVIADPQQARIVPDYTVQVAAPPPPPAGSAEVEVHLTPLLQPAAAAPSVQPAPGPPADPASTPPPGSPPNSVQPAPGASTATPPSSSLAPTP